MSEATDALIGYSGFVGSNISKQRSFGFLYNSKNIESIEGQKFDVVVCAGAPGTKWIANQNPQEDFNSINRLINSLKNISCNKFVLVSTIDVYDPATEVNEDTAIDAQKLKPYGKHRRLLEEFVIKNFDCLIVRLPGIFGDGLKKNVIYDLKNGIEIKLSPNSLLQFYWLKYLWKDISQALSHKLPLLNIATEPALLQTFAKEAFGVNLPIDPKKTGAYYNMQTKYSSLWNNSKPYLYTQEEWLNDLNKWLKTGT